MILTPFQFSQLKKCVRAFQYSIRKQKRTRSQAEIAIKYHQIHQMAIDFMAKQGAYRFSRNRLVDPYRLLQSEFGQHFYLNGFIRTRYGRVRIPLLERSRTQIRVYYFHLGELQNEVQIRNIISRLEYHSWVISQVLRVHNFVLVSVKDSPDGRSKLLNELDISERLRYFAENSISELQARALEIRKSSELIAVPYGKQCGLGTEYQCPYADECLNLDNETNLIRFKGFSKKDVFALLRRGIDDIRNIPYSLDLSKSSRRIASQAKAQIDHVDPQSIFEWIDTNKLWIHELTQPLLFMDFEAYQFRYPLSPSWYGMDKLPFQFSIHVLYGNSRSLLHHEYLWLDEQNPFRTFAQRLLDSIRLYMHQGARIIVYNKSFEISVLNALGEHLPEFKDELWNLKSKIVDLMEPFRRHFFYSPKQYGGYSLKYVYPQIYNHLPDQCKHEYKDYQNLKVNNGLSAVAAYIRFYRLLQKDSINSQNAGIMAELRQSLLEYCNLDTESMVLILKALNKIASP